MFQLYWAVGSCDNSKSRNFAIDVATGVAGLSIVSEWFVHPTSCADDSADFTGAAILTARRSVTCWLRKVVVKCD